MKKIALVLVAVALIPAYIYAVDGQVLINQSTLNAAGGTYTITQPGSYKLSGNLQVKDENTTAILILSDNVTIDLNGFAILGLTDCIITQGFPCEHSGSGSGISTGPGTTLHYNITIRNGAIQGMGNSAIVLFGSSFLVEYLHVRNNPEGIAFGTHGIDSIGYGVVQHCTVEDTGDVGIAAGGSIHHNTVVRNSMGIITHPNGGTTVSDNSVRLNRATGLFANQGTSYKGNVFSGNKFNVAGTGVNQGQNLCDNAACPGAVL